MNNSRTILLFYFLVTYILLQFLWWLYLIIQLNGEILELKFSLTGNNKIQTDELSSKIFMLAGESLVFMVILAAGVWHVRKSFYKETALAKQQKNFLLSVTHELKTPIASAKLQIQTLLLRNLNKEKQEQLLQKSVNDLERLDQLTEKVLLATRLENKNFNPTFTQINFSEFLEEFLSNYLNSRKNNHYKIKYFIQPDLFIYADETSLYSIINNLIDNALKYSEDQGTIEIQLQKAENKICFSVADNGIGINDNEKNLIFEKFYRSGNEETRSRKGTGLGLFIVKLLADMNKAQIKVENNFPKGTIFKINFPSL